jgi:hypothetical protein
MLHGDPALITHEDQQAISNWAFKTSYVLDSAAIGEGKLGFPQAHRTRLYDTGLLPEFSAAWVSSWPGTSTSWTHHWGVPVVSQSRLTGAVSETFAYGATIALGPIVMRTFAATDEPLAPKHFHEGRTDVFQVWPTQPPIDWQRKFWLTANELEDWAYTIPRAIEQLVPGTREFFDPERPLNPPARPE